jgi:transcriptional enhancer factor
VGTDNDLQDHADLACYSTKPNWQHANLISQLENAAEQYHAYLPHDNHHIQATQGHEVLHGHDMYQQVSQSQGDDLVGHGLHDSHVGVGHGLRSLASPFQEDTRSGAVNGVDCRKEQAHGLGFGLLDLIERDARARGY